MEIRKIVERSGKFRDLQQKMRRVVVDRSIPDDERARRTQNLQQEMNDLLTGR